MLLQTPPQVPGVTDVDPLQRDWESSDYGGVRVRINSGNLRSHRGGQMSNRDSPPSHVFKNNAHSGANMPTQQTFVKRVFKNTSRNYGLKQSKSTARVNVEVDCANSQSNPSHRAAVRRKAGANTALNSSDSKGFPVIQGASSQGTG